MYYLISVAEQQTGLSGAEISSDSAVLIMIHFFLANVYTTQPNSSSQILDSWNKPFKVIASILNVQ